MGLWLYGVVRGLTFYSDEWRLAAERSEWTAQALLAPFDGRLMAVPIAAYNILFDWKGLLTYNHYAAMLVAAHVGAAWALGLAVNRWAGVLPAAGAAIVLLTYGWASHVLLWPGAIGVPIAVGAGLGTWVLWDRRSLPMWRGTLGAFTGIVAIGSAPFGLAFVLVASVHLALDGGPRRRLLWPALVIAAFVAWLVTFGVAGLSLATGETIWGIWQAINVGIGRTAGSLVGMGDQPSTVVAVALAVGVAVTLAWRGRPRREFWIALGGVICVYLVTPTNPDRPGIADASSYGAMAFALIAAMLLLTAAMPRGSRRERLAVGAVVVWVLVLAVRGTAFLAAELPEWRQRATATEAQLITLQLFPELAAARGAEVVDERLFGPTTYSELTAAGRTLGYPVPGLVESIVSRGDDGMRAADAAIARMASLALLPVFADAPPADTLATEWFPSRAVARTESEVAGCAAFAVSVPNDPSIEATLNPGERLFVRSDGQEQLQVYARVFSNRYQESASSRRYIEPHAWYVLTPPDLPDATVDSGAGTPRRLSWSIRIDPPADAGRVDLCRATAPTVPVNLTLEPYVADVPAPIAIAAAPGEKGTIYVGSRRGLIQRFVRHTDERGPVLDLTGDVSLAGEQGLLGMAFHPNYPTDNRLFVTYTSLADELVVAEFEIDSLSRTVDRSSERRLLAIQRPTTQHNGGMLAFGPDGFLYVSSGDGTYDPESGLAGTGQDPRSLLGVIIRVDVDAEVVANEPYAIPTDNPHIPGAPEVWAYGLRNPWRFSFDRLTGDLWIADVGQHLWEEINFEPEGARGGRNYGWDVVEGRECYLALECGGSDLTEPVAVYRHGNGNCAVTGGYVYRGSRIPGLYGHYVFADYCSGRIWSLSGPAAAPVELVNTGKQIVSFGEDGDGELYVAAILEGTVYRLGERRAP